MNTLALLLGAAFTTWWVDPYGDVPYLPDAEPHGGVVTNVLSCAAAKGEIETLHPGSLVVCGMDSSQSRSPCSRRVISKRSTSAPPT